MTKSNAVQNNPPLTKKRQEWAAKRKGNVLFEGKPLRYNVSVQQSYERDIKKLVRFMTTTVNRELTKLFDSQTAENFYQTVAMDADIASQARILTNKLYKQYEQLFGRKAPLIANKMVNSTDKTSKTNLHASLKDVSGGLSLNTGALPKDLKTIIKASVAENVALIKSIATEYLSKVQKTVLYSITTGEGLATIQPSLEKYDGISERKAKNLALDQTRKVYNNMNAERMQKVGFTQFMWLHSGGGQKPRPSHEAMNGEIYSFDDPPRINLDNPKEPPEYGIPGQTYNCKCTMKPIYKMSE